MAQEVVIGLLLLPLLLVPDDDTHRLGSRFRLGGREESCDSGRCGGSEEVMAGRGVRHGVGPSWLSVTRRSAPYDRAPVPQWQRATGGGSVGRGDRQPTDRARERRLPIEHVVVDEKSRPIDLRYITLSTLRVKPALPVREDHNGPRTSSLCFRRGLMTLSVAGFRSGVENR